MSYELGDVAIENLTMTSSRGTVDLAPMCFGISIYESLFTPGIVMDVTVIDSQDVMGTLRLQGDETIALVMSVPGSIRTTYQLAVYEVSGVTSVGAQSGKTYDVKAVSLETIKAKTNYVMKAYHSLCSDVVKDIHSTFLGSKKPIVLEPTMGVQDLVVPNMDPYKAIKMITRRSVSPENKSCSYVYFESVPGGTQTSSFVTIESLFGKSSVKEFVRSDAVSADITKRTDNNILSLSTPRATNSLDRVDIGGNRRVITYNHTTQQFNTNVVSTSSSSFKTGGNNQESQYFDKTFGSDTPSSIFVPVDWNERAETYIAQAAAAKSAYVALLLQNSIKLKVVGDTVLTAGCRIIAHYPDRTALSGAPKDDPLLSGSFVCARLHHRIGPLQQRPRFTTTMECVKAGTGAQS